MYRILPLALLVAIPLTAYALSVGDSTDLSFSTPGSSSTEQKAVCDDIDNGDLRWFNGVHPRAGYCDFELKLQHCEWVNPPGPGGYCECGFGEEAEDGARVEQVVPIGMGGGGGGCADIGWGNLTWDASAN